MGWTWKIFAEAWMSLHLGFAVAFTIDSLVVGTPAKAFAHKYLIKKNSSHAHCVLSISLSIVIPMVTLMSFYGAILARLHGAEISIFTLWGINLLRNLPAAIISNSLIAGPIARRIFGWIFQKKEKQLEKLAEEDA
ncbi:MAG: hypothetical protein WAV68_03320 [Candidatus Nanogingivalis sp.]